MKEKDNLTEKEFIEKVESFLEQDGWIKCKECKSVGNWTSFVKEGKCCENMV